MLSVNCILLWFIDIYLIKVEFICKRNAYITLVWGFFFSFFLSGCYLPYEPPKEAVFFLQNLVKVFVLLISGQQQSDI